MQQKLKVIRAWAKLKVAGLVLVGIATSVLAVLPAQAAGTVAKFVMTPHPLGTANTTTAGVTMNIAVTAETSANAPVPGATEFLSFTQAIGGGTAFVGTLALQSRPQPFIADASGSVIVAYSTPPAYPTNGVDVIKAQNAATLATSTVHTFDPFCFSRITSLAFVPKAIARKGSLGPNTTIPVTLTVFGPNATRYANGTVWVSFKKASGGGSASVGGVAFSTGAPKAFTTNSLGQVAISYTTPATLPATGADRLVAGDAAANGCITATDSYTY